MVKYITCGSVCKSTSAFFMKSVYDEDREIVYFIPISRIYNPVTAG